MDKDIARVVKKNQDVIVFVRDLLEGEPGMKTQAVKNELYKKFGFERFARRSFVVQILICVARSDHERKVVEEN